MAIDSVEGDSIADRAGLPAALLHSASYYGTLAATRALGRAGVPVAVASTGPFECASWSRYARRRLRCPPTERTADYLQWLRALGANEPGMVLVPTSDDHAWLFARYAEELGAGFRCRSPSAETILGLLDKRRLAEACAAAGLATLPSWFPQDEAELRAVESELEYPVVVKPRTQLFHRTRFKGTVAERSSLLAAWQRLDGEGCSDPELLAREPGLRHPFLQAFASDPQVGIVSVSGFIDPAAGIFVCRCSRKLPDDHQRLDVGRWFEALPTDPSLAEGLLVLCKNTGFAGVFEAEFAPFEGKLALIDFNPRLYGQLGFDEARGASLAQLAYLHALGDSERLRRLASAGQRGSEHGLYINRVALAVQCLPTIYRDEPIGRLQICAGWPSKGTPVFAAARGAPDFILDAGDPAPAVVEAFNLLAGSLRRSLGSLLRRGRSRRRLG